MAPRTLTLAGQRWTLGSRIGDRSGFGQVFLATADDGTDGVIKLVPKDPGAERELLFDNLAGTPNVVPIIDSGETPTHWALAMPRASFGGGFGQVRHPRKYYPRSVASPRKPR